MATEGTPYQGLDYAASKIYTSALSLVCYTNTANSLGDSSTYATLTQPTGGGYAPITLDGVWTFNNGTVSYLKAGANPGWLATGVWSGQVIGAAMVDIASGKLLHYRDNAAVFTAAAGKRLEIDITTLVA